jgi:hypothetical protein
LIPSDVHGVEEAGLADRVDVLRSERADDLLAVRASSATTMPWYTAESVRLSIARTAAANIAARMSIFVLSVEELLFSVIVISFAIVISLSVCTLRICRA